MPAPQEPLWSSRHQEPSKEAGTASSDFERQVREALAHLYDLAYLQNHALSRLLQPRPRASDAGRALQRALVDAVESLKPAAAPPDPHASRAYQILHLRYVEAMPAVEAEKKLAIGRSEFFDDQRRATEAVASILRARWGLEEQPTEPPILSIVGRGEGPGSPGIPGYPDRTSTAPPCHNLPAPLTSFVGREWEIAEVKRLVETTRLLTLTGAGGCGKTRLAYQVAADLLDEYPDGVWAAELAPISDPGLVPKVVAGAVGVREAEGEPIASVLLEVLVPRQLLLVLDNCEHLIDASAALVDSLLRACPKVRILATSRESLGVPGEIVWRVPSLSVPDEREPPLSRSWMESEAVALFVARARAVQPTFAITEQNAPAVAQVCRQLDGIPLAIELAAARLRALAVEQLAARLDQRFQILTSGSRTVLPRQQTLQATMDWSYDLLPDSEKALLRRLSAFAGGCTLEAAEAVAGDGGQGSGDGGRGSAGEAATPPSPPSPGPRPRSPSSEPPIPGPWPPSPVIDLLTRLVDKSLVQVETAADGTIRYRLLETVRQYAHDRLLVTGEASAVRSRHKDWCLALAELAEPAIHTAGLLEWLPRLELEHDNLRLALAWCLDEDPRSGLRMASSLRLFWQLRGYCHEGLAWAERLLQRVPEPTAVRAKGLLSAGDLAFWQACQPWYEQGLALAREIGDDRLIGWGARGVAMSLINTPRFAESRSLLEEALALSRKDGYQLATGVGLRLMGEVAEREGNLPGAHQCYEESLEVLREAGNRNEFLHTVYWLGLVLARQGFRGEARTRLEEALGLAEEMRATETRFEVQVELGLIALSEGQTQAALAHLEAAHATARAAHDRPGIVYGLLMLGQIARLSGDLARGATLLEEGRALFFTMDDRGGAPDDLLALVTTASGPGQVTWAMSHLRERLVPRQGGIPHSRSSALPPATAVLAHTDDTAPEGTATPTPRPAAPISPAEALPAPTPAATAPSPLTEALAGRYRGTVVTVGGPYGGGFAVDYVRSLKGFEQSTGISIQYVKGAGDPATNDALAAGVHVDVDVLELTIPMALLPPTRRGMVVDITRAVDLDTLRDRYDHHWLDAAMMSGPNGPIVAGVYTACYLQDVVWYPRAAFERAGYRVPTTWVELIDLSDRIHTDGGTPWLIGNAYDGGKDGMIWIQSAMLRTAPVEDYDRWLRGELRFNSPQVRRAVQLVSELWLKPGYAYGGREAIARLNRWDLPELLLADPPEGWLMLAPSFTPSYDGASDTTGFLCREYGTDYDFFPLPPIDPARGRPALVEGHIAAMLHDRPEVRALIDYLTTGAQFEAWARMGRMGLSPQRGARLEWYANPLDRAVAEATRQAARLRTGPAELSPPLVYLVFGAAVAGYIAGTADLETALDAVDRAVDLCRRHREPVSRPARTPAPSSVRGPRSVLVILRERSMDMELVLAREVGVMVSMLQSSGDWLVLASPSGQSLVGGTTTVRPDLRLAEVNVDDYAGLLLPSMAPPLLDSPAIPPESAGIVRRAAAQGKTVAAQVFGVLSLVEAGVLNGRRYAWPAYLFAEGVYAGMGVVEDANVITSATCPFIAARQGGPDGTRELTQKLIDALAASG